MCAEGSKFGAYSGVIDASDHALLGIARRRWSEIARASGTIDVLASGRDAGVGKRGAVRLPVAGLVGAKADGTEIIGFQRNEAAQTRFAIFIKEFAAFPTFSYTCWDTGFDGFEHARFDPMPQRNALLSRGTARTVRVRRTRLQTKLARCHKMRSLELCTCFARRARRALADLGTSSSRRRRQAEVARRTQIAISTARSAITTVVGGILAQLAGRVAKLPAWAGLVKFVQTARYARSLGGEDRKAERSKSHTRPSAQQPVWAGRTRWIARL